MTEVPDLLIVEDLISCKLNNRRKLARLMTQYRDIFIFPIFRNVWSSFFRVLQRMTLELLNVTNLKYEIYVMTSEKINRNKRLIDRAK